MPDAGTSRAAILVGSVGRAKVEVAKRVAHEANPKVRFEAIEGSVVDASVACRLTDVDFLFLATDTMQSRLIFNVLVHQYLIPGIQIPRDGQRDEKQVSRKATEEISSF